MRPHRNCRCWSACSTSLGWLESHLVSSGYGREAHCLLATSGTLFFVSTDSAWNFLVFSRWFNPS
jgi:hypothetical protein